jgi:hypothetical protein
VVSFTAAERLQIIEEVEAAHDCRIDVTSIDTEFEITRGYSFENSDFKDGIYTMSLSPRVKESGAKAYRVPDSKHPIWQAIAVATAKRVPRIFYFPTFLFSVPDRILLNPLSEKLESEIQSHIVSF